MKKIISSSISLLFVLMAASVLGQIPNNGFERWIDVGTYLKPEGWWTINDSVPSGGFYPVTRSADHFPAEIGNYSIRLENNLSLFPSWNSMGIIWTGDFSGNDNPVFKVFDHPTSLWGYFKFFPQNGDTMEIHIRMYKNSEDIGGGSFKTAEWTEVWTPFSINLSDYTEVDSARIMISSCYDNDEPLPHGNSVLYMDNLSFDHLITTATSDVYTNNKITVYPNPANEALWIWVNDVPAEQLELYLYSTFGEQVLNRHFPGSTEPVILDISGLSGGTYFIHALADHRPIGYTKIIIPW